MNTRQVLLNYTNVAIETMKYTSSFTTTQSFFEPHPEFIDWMREFAKNTVVVDCGAGLCNTTLALQTSGVNAVALDLYPSPNAMVKEVLGINAVLFPFSESFTAMICRPCRGDWIHATIISAVESGAQCVYVGKESHYEADLEPLPYKITKIMENAGLSNESVWTIGRK